MNDNGRDDKIAFLKSKDKGCLERGTPRPGSTIGLITNPSELKTARAKRQKRKIRLGLVAKRGPKPGRRMSASAKLPFDPRGPECFGVVGFLPGYVITKRDTRRLLDLYDLCHLALTEAWAGGPSAVLTVEHYRRVRPIVEHSRKHLLDHYGKLMERGAEHAQLLGLPVTARAVQTEDGPRIALWITRPFEVKERVSRMLDSLTPPSDEPDTMNLAA